MYMQVTINVPEEVAEAAQAQGLSVEAYIEDMVARIGRLRELHDASKLDRKELTAEAEPPTGDAPAFRPVRIRGEELSATILRNRR